MRLAIGIVVGAFAILFVVRTEAEVLRAQVVPAISEEKILPSSDVSGRTGPLTIRAARGEFEAASFVLQAEQQLDGVTLRASPLVGNQGSIPAAAVDIRVVKPWFQSFYAWGNIGKVRPDDFRQQLVPELLLYDDSLVLVDEERKTNRVRVGAPEDGTYVRVNWPRLAKSERVHPPLRDFAIRDAHTLQEITLGKDRNKQIWVTVRVPDNAIAGTYSGTITIEQNGASIYSLPVELEIAAFDLASPKLVVSIYYRAVLDEARAAIGSDFKSLEQLRSELRNLRAHGVANPTVYQPPNPRESFEAYLAELRGAGFETKELFLAGFNTSLSSAGGLTQLRSIVDRTKHQVAPLGFSTLFVYGRDEAVGDVLRGELVEYATVRRSGAQVFVAGYDEVFSIAGDHIDLFVHFGRPKPTEAARWHAKGSKVFSYANPQTGPESPYRFRRNYGVVPWAAGYDGVMPYAYQHSMGHIWNDMDHAIYRDHVLAYPTVNGVIDTLAWEGFREGVDDLRYLATVERLIELRRGSSDAKTSAAVAEASAYLGELRARTLRLGGKGKYTAGFDLDLDRVRRDLSEYAARLSSVE